MDREQGANAAVTLVLSRTASGFHILFVKRAENPADPWSGQIGLPGGKLEPEDGSLMDCAIRETREETGIDLNQGRFLGLLPALRSLPRPELTIVPFIILFEHKPLVSLSLKELESFIWLSLDSIRENRRVVRIGLRDTPAFVVGTAVIWGLTYRILESFIEIFTSLN